MALQAAACRAMSHMMCDPATVQTMKSRGKVDWMLRGGYGALDKICTMTRAGQMLQARHGTHIHSATWPHSGSHSLGEFSGNGVHSSIRQFPIGDLLHARHQILVARCYHLISPARTWHF